MNFSKIIFKDAITGSLDKILNTLRAATQDDLHVIRECGGSIFISKRIYTLLNHIYANTSGIDSMLAGILLECIHEAELLVPGAGAAIIDLVDARQIISLTDVSQSEPIFLTRDHMVALFSSFKFNDSISRVVKTAVELAGMNGKIFIDNSKTGDTVIELRCGYNFSFILPIGPFGGEKKWEKNWCKCLVIDGVVETLGEIDGILQESTREREPMAIFARGFSSDVLNTLKVNVDRKTLDVLPISFGIDNIKTVNSIADIAKILGADIITPLKGDIIAMTRFSELRTIQKIVCHNGSVMLVNGSTEMDVGLHLQELHRKVMSSHHEVVRLLNDRIRSLSSKCVLINVGSAAVNNSEMSIDELDAALNLLAAAIKWGVTEDNSTAQLPVKCPEVDRTLAPAALFPVAVKYSNIFLKKIDSLNIAIIHDT